MGGHRRQHDNHHDNDTHHHNRSNHNHDPSDDETAATGRLTELAGIMGRAGRGDGDAVVALIMEFGAPIGATMRRHLAALGVRHVDADDLQGLVIDACIELGLHGGSWDPARGALPWVWAERRLRMVASRFVGQWADPLDDDASRQRVHVLRAADAADAPAADEAEEIDVLRSLAGRRVEARLLCEALDCVTTERNQRILLAYRLQASLGDPSPAITTGRRFGMRPDAVRQVVKRTSDKLAALIAREPRFAALADLALVA